MSEMYSLLLKEYEMEQLKCAIKKAIHDLFDIYKRVHVKKRKKVKVRYHGKRSAFNSLIKAQAPPGMKFPVSLIKECLIESGAKTMNSGTSIFYVNVVPKSQANKEVCNVPDTPTDDAGEEPKPNKYVYVRRGLIKSKRRTTDVTL